jgi:hypothetical protein
MSARNVKCYTSLEHLVWSSFLEYSWKKMVLWKCFLLPIRADTHHTYRLHTRVIRINMANMTIMNISDFTLSFKINAPHCGVLGCNTLKYCRLIPMHWKNSILRVKLNILRICLCYTDKWPPSPKNRRGGGSLKAKGDKKERGPGHNPERQIWTLTAVKTWKLT